LFLWRLAWRFRVGGRGDSSLDCAGRKVFAVGLLTLLFVLFVAGILVGLGEALTSLAAWS